MEFITEYSIWFIVGGIILMMTLIGYIADKSNYIEKQKNKNKAKKDSVIEQKQKYLSAIEEKIQDKKEQYLEKEEPEIEKRNIDDKIEENVQSDIEKKPENGVLNLDLYDNEDEEKKEDLWNF